ncbi:hypothetical protein BU16DRAFT_565569 [Lophium mytilinum]|uniref:Uncharacterized protein n=1 Tax=Lophium mytilinum TaxID=390894 RepID=A0A6A6QJL7_9PEZI|nr:hypothetical protein BU16DRAFT_565569 [Lophium mytilinum]
MVSPVIASRLDTRELDDQGDVGIKDATQKELEIAVREEVHESNDANFLHYLHRIKTTPVTATWPGTSHRFFKFELKLEGFPWYRPKPKREWTKTVSLRLVNSPGGKRRSVDGREGGRWIPLRQILQNRPIALQPTGTIGYQELRNWWIARGGSFEFLSLPGELRNEVYKYLVCTVVYPYSWRGRNALLKLTEWDGSGSTGLLKSEHGPMGTHVRTAVCASTSFRQGVLIGAAALKGLLLSSKQIYYEVSGLLWKSMEFRFQEHGDQNFKLERFAYAISKVNRQAIRRITLQASPRSVDGWFENRKRINTNTCRCQVLLLFSPSVRLVIKLPHRSKHDDEMFLDPCQRKCWRELVGKVLWKGRFILAHFDTVEVTGCINPQVRTHYLQLLQDLRGGQLSTVLSHNIMGQCVDVGLKPCIRFCRGACQESWCVCQGVLP